MEELNCKQVAQIYDQDTNPINGRVYDPYGVAPTLRMPTGGNSETKIVELINTDKDGISRTTTSHYHKAGASDFRSRSVGNPTPHTAVIEIYKNKHVQKMVDSGKINPEKVQYLDTYNQIARDDVASTISTRTDANNDCYVTEPITCASRKCGDNHKLEMGKNIANSITTIDTDSMIAEPNKEPSISVHPLSHAHEFDGKVNKEVSPCLRATDHKAPHCVWEPQVLASHRTQVGRELRKQGIEKFENRELVPREDGVSGTLTSVQKDNLLAEPTIIGSNQKNAYRGSTDGVSPCVNAAMGMGGGHVPMVTEPLEENSDVFYKGRKIADGEGLYLADTDRFFRGGLSGVSRTLKAETHDAGVCCGYRIRKLTPKECFRLMDVSEEDIDKIQSAGISKSAQYRLAGNSIVVSCLYHIFKELFITKSNPIQPTLF